MEGRKLYDRNAERGILACCFIDDGSVDQCMESGVTVDDFHFTANRLIFSAMMDVAGNAGAVDEISVSERLNSQGLLEEVGGYKYLTHVGNSVETTGHLKHWIEIVREYWRLRKIETVYREGLDSLLHRKQSSKELIEHTESGISEVAFSERSQIATPRTLAEQSDDFIASLDEEGGMIGLSSGLLDFDQMTRGFKPGEVIVVGGRPGTGKTSLMLRFLEAAAEPWKGYDRTNVLLFSLEMKSRDVMGRYLGQKAKVDIRKVNDERKTRLREAASTIGESGIHIVDNTSLTIHEIQAITRSAVRRYGIGLVILDYIQIVAPSGKSGSRMVEEVATTSRCIKAMAMELDIPVVVGSQFSRDMEKGGRRPRLSDLKESGAIEQDCDVALLLHMEDEEENYTTKKVTGIVAKQRNGPTGDIEFAFTPQFTLFENYTGHEQTTK